MKILSLSKIVRLAAVSLAGLAMCQALQAAEMLNAGFNATTGWSGTFRAGTNGGDSWTTTYFVGGIQPTGTTFGSRFESAVKQNLTGANNTFQEGASYTITAQLFSAGNYADSRNAKIMWSLGFTADGSPVASDHWFSDEFTAQTAANGGPIPDDHIVSITSSSNGLTTATFTFTATAAEAGKVIGIQIAGENQTRYAGVTGFDDRFAMIDNIAFSSSIATLASFTSDIQVLDGSGFNLNWTIDKPELISTLTLDSGSGPTDVKPDTNLETGVGSVFVDPAASTTYTLTLNGNQQSQLTVHAGKALSLTRDSNTRVALAPSYQVRLNWSVQPADASVSLSDGVTSIDVTADTDPESGLGTALVTVPNPSTIFTLSANGSPLVASTRVLRETANTAAFSINSPSILVGQPVTVTWAGAAGGAKDWVGIYKATETPGGNAEYSVDWNYLSGNRTPVAGFTDGSMSFTLPAGNYYAVLLLDDAYGLAQGPIMFSVVQPPPVEEAIKVISITKEANGVTLVWESKAGVAYNIFASDDLLGDPLVDWDAVSTSLPSDGDDTTDYTESFESGAPARRFYRIYEAPPAQ